jgi:hypothetical protein
MQTHDAASIMQDNIFRDSVLTFGGRPQSDLIGATSNAPG